MKKISLLLLNLIVAIPALGDMTRAFEMRSDQYVMVARCSNGAVQRIPYSKEQLRKGVDFVSKGIRYEALLLEEKGQERLQISRLPKIKYVGHKPEIILVDWSHYKRRKVHPKAYPLVNGQGEDILGELEATPHRSKRYRQTVGKFVFGKPELKRAEPGYYLIEHYDRKSRETFFVWHYLDGDWLRVYPLTPRPEE